MAKCNVEKILDKLRNLQREFNDTLIDARNVNLKVDVTVSDTNCFEGDTAVAIGLDVYEVINKRRFCSDGRP